MGTDINKIVPDGETIDLFRPGSFIYPAIFRFKPPTRYIYDANDIDEQVHYMLVKQKDWGVTKRTGENLRPFSAGDPEICQPSTQRILVSAAGMIKPVVF